MIRLLVSSLLLLVLSFLSGGCHSFVVRPNPKNYISSTISSSQHHQKRIKQQQQQQQKSSTFLFSTNTNNNNNDDDDIINCDVLVLGAGPTGRAMSKLLASSSSSSLKIVLADAKYDSPLVPNYGVWQDEWQSIVDRYQDRHGIEIKGGTCGKALDTVWSQTDCFFGGSFDTDMTERTRLDRPYGRIDKEALVTSFDCDNHDDSNDNDSNIQIIRANHLVQETSSINLHGDTMVHSDVGTTTKLSNGQTIQSKLVIDATGHESKLVLRDVRAAGETPPGYQIAYGMTIETDALLMTDDGEEQQQQCFFGPYDKDCMTLFDYRTDHLIDPTGAEREQPTFMYVMPLSDTQVFFEETSLVARDPAMSFQECQDRCYQRLKYLNIPIKSIVEEEYCYIPMGGALPAKDQRVIGIGGAAAMVHPSTGYHLCRMLMGASDMATTIIKELEEKEDNNNKDNNEASSNTIMKKPDAIARLAYHSIWTPEAIRQRNFAIFGGEYLMSLDVQGLRGFFTGFFQLPLEMWGGFLAGWKGLPYNTSHESWWNRMWFGIQFIVRIPPVVAVDMVWNILLYCIQEEGFPLPQSVTPLCGEPASYLLSDNDTTTTTNKENNEENLLSMRYDGDWTVKKEAQQMILSRQEESKEEEAAVVEEVPVQLL